MWHQEILNQQLDKIVKQVVICQKVVRGFLCRRRLIHLLELVQQQSNEKIAFINQIHKQGSIVLEKLNSLKVKIKKSDLEPLTTVYEMAESLSEQHQHQMNQPEKLNVHTSSSSHHHNHGKLESAAAKNQPKISKHNTNANANTTNKNNSNSLSNNYNNNNINKLSNNNNGSAAAKTESSSAQANNNNNKKGEKIQSLKNQLEKQMKDYVKQEEYEEMLKLVKVISLTNILYNINNSFFNINYCDILEIEPDFERKMVGTTK